MAPPIQRASVAELLQHQSWIRELAAELASDSSAADELYQRTWLAILEHPPRRDGSLRGWLRSVVHNFARQEHRARSRRQEHEERAAASEALPAAADVVARASVQRAVAEAVFELDEPYRTTVLLRFFDDLPPRAIAERMGVPVDTVRTRLARALARLRQQLDRDLGSRDAWLVALLPGLPRAGTTVPLLTGSLLMSSKLLLVAALVVAASLVGFFLMRDTTSTAAPFVARTEAPLDQARPKSIEVPLAQPESSARTRGEGAVAAVESQPTGSALPKVAAARDTLHGRVIDDRGTALAEVPVGVSKSRTVRPTDVAATSDSAGRFEIQKPSGPVFIVAMREGYTTALAGVPGKSASDIEPVVVVARAAKLGGRVFGEEGLPIARAMVEVVLPDGFRTRLQTVLDRSVSIDWMRESDAGGGFAFDAVPLVEGARLRAQSDGYLPFDAPLAELIGTDVLVTLSRLHSQDGIVRGRVVDSSGAAVEDAHVAFGVATMETDKEGTFAFALEDPKSSNARFGFAPESIVALKKGFLPARYVPGRKDGTPEWPATITLKLGETPLAVSGRVVGHDHEPLANVRVWLADAELFGAGKKGPMLVENLLAGEPGRLWRFVETDGQGRFEITGLAAREYTLRAMDPKTLLHADESPVPAGVTDVEIRLPTDQLIPRVAGKIVGHDGTPLAGVRVYPMCDAFRLRAKGSVISTSHDSLDGTTTDKEGRFELANLPKSFVYLRIEGEDVLPLEYGRDTRDAPGTAEGSSNRIPDAELEKLVIAVDRRCHLQVELIDPSSADALEVLDAQGRKMDINVYLGSGRNTDDRSPIEAGKSNTMAISDAARTLVLLKGETEVWRAPLELKPGETTKLKL